MSKAKEVFRKAKVLFLCAFVATQIFIPQAVVEAATCKHTETKNVLINTVVKGHTYHTFEYKYDGTTKNCTVTICLNDYAIKCKKCNTTTGAFSKQEEVHGNSYCPKRK